MPLERSRRVAGEAGVGGAPPSAKFLDEIGRRARAAARSWALTPRQADVLAILARGHSNHEIAAALGCAVSTIEIHVTALLSKTRSQNRAELVAKFWTQLG